MNFKLLKELFREHANAVTPHISEEHIYAHCMLLYRAVPTLITAEFNKSMWSSEFVRNHAQLIAMSPVSLHTLDNTDLLKSLQDKGDGLIVLSPSRRLNDKIWKPDESAPLDRGYVWPLAVNSETVVKRPGAGRYRRTKADVASWTWATAYLPREYIRLISAGIVNDGLPVKAVVVDNNGVMAVFQVNAENHDEWTSRCKEIRTHLLAEGLPIVSFRIDSLIPLQHGTQKHGTIIYLA